MIPTTRATILLCLLSCATPIAAATEDAIPSGPTSLGQDTRGHIWLSVDGEQGQVIERVRATNIVRLRGDIRGFAIGRRGSVWAVQGKRVLRWDPSDERWIDRTPSFQPTATLRGVFVSRSGTVWAGGARYRQQGSGLFQPIQHGGGLMPVCDDPFGNVWAVRTSGSRRGQLAVRHRSDPAKWSVPDGEPGGREIIGRPVCDDVGYVWVAGKHSLWRVDPRAKSGTRQVDAPDQSEISSLARLANGQVLVGFRDGRISSLTLAANNKPVWNSWAQTQGGAARAMLHDRDGYLWAVVGHRLIQVKRVAIGGGWQVAWQETSRMPAGNHDHIFARIGDRLYTAGGKTYYGWPADKWVNLDHIWSYDIRTKDWRLEPPMLEPGKSYSGIATLNGELWLLGGYFRVNGGIRPTDTVEIYNPVTRQVRLGPPLPKRLGQVIGMTVDKKLYAIGGGGEKENSKSIFSIQAGQKKWTSEDDAPVAIAQASGCLLDKTIYIASAAGAQCEGLWAFDTVSNEWSHFKNPLGSPHNAPLCAAHRGEVWILGGVSSKGGTRSSYAYSPKSKKWRRGHYLPLPVSWGAAASVDGRLFIAGGAYREPLVGNYFNSDRCFFLREKKLTPANSR